MSQPVRIMPCLDMRDGRVVKGVRFVDIRDAGDPVACARAYCEKGADELAMLDITATVEGRATLLQVVRNVAEAVTVPFTVGGGISDVKRAGDDGAGQTSFPVVARSSERAYTNWCGRCRGHDVDRKRRCLGYEVYIDGGRTATGHDAVEWAKRVDGLGVRVILPTSKAGDGARTGYDLPVIHAIRQAVSA